MGVNFYMSGKCLNLSSFVSKVFLRMKYLSVVFFLFVSVSGFTQQNHFIYIQADNKQPFYVVLDKKLMSSSASGYLIIPKLRDSSYKLSIGFPKNEWPEQKVTCNINQADAGYLLKNFGEKGWGLFNLQTMALVMADTATNKDVAVVKETKKDSFAEILSGVVNDPGLLNTQKTPEDSIAIVPVISKKSADKIVAKKEIKPVIKDNKTKTRIAKLSDKKNRDSLRMVYVDMVKGNSDTVNVVIPFEAKKKITKPVTDLAKANKKQKHPVKDTASNIIAEKKVETPVVELVKANNNLADIIKDTITHTIPEKKVKQSVADLVKNNKNTGHIIPDTVSITVPEKKVEEPVTDIVKTDNKKENPVVDTTVHIQPEIKKEDSVITAVNTIPVGIIPESSKKDTVVVVKPVEVVVVEKKTDIANVIPKPVENMNTNVARVFNPCREEASGDDFLGLRKKMDKSKSDNEMLYHAHKAFTKMCYTTKQIERLSLLFTTDDAKYKFFDDAYQYVADRENFPGLASQLKEAYYINRFNAMIR